MLILKSINYWPRERSANDSVWWRRRGIREGPWARAVCGRKTWPCYERLWWRLRFGECGTSPYWGPSPTPQTLVSNSASTTPPENHGVSLEDYDSLKRWRAWRRRWKRTILTSFQIHSGPSYNMWIFRCFHYNFYLFLPFLKKYNLKVKTKVI